MPNATLTAAIDKIAAGSDLSADEAADVLGEIMADEASEIEIAGFLMALRTKGETVDEVAGLARTMRALATRVDAGRDDLLDTAGTGGGTVADAKPDYEFEESVAKAKGVLQAIELAVDQRDWQ